MNSSVQHFYTGKTLSIEYIIIRVKHVEDQLRFLHTASSLHI